MLICPMLQSGMPKSFSLELVAQENRRLHRE
jgi:hypothetical protein